MADMNQTEDKRASNPNLVCPNCLSVFTDTKLLSCGHTFCLQCLTDHDTQGRKDQLTCPICAKTTKLSKQGSRKTTGNRIASAVVKNFKRKSEGDLMDTSLYHPGLPLGVCSPVILKEVDLPVGMAGMAVVSRDAVAIGYGRGLPGAELITASGIKQPFLPGEVGPVSDIAVLSDGRAVISHGKKGIRIYARNGSSEIVTLPQGPDNTTKEHWRVCADGDDNIYAVNATKTIQVVTTSRKIKKSSWKHVREIGTDPMNAFQICVTSSRTIVAISSTRDLSYGLTFLDKDGKPGSGITSPGVGEILCAAVVDAHDRVIVGQFYPVEGTLALSVCTLQGSFLLNRYFLKPMGVAKSAQGWCQLAFLNPNLLAFAHMGKKLYFIQMPQLF